ncbi:MAG: thiol-disulfide isomerase/thioredoxin [Kiritimatiellia bacterium]|jgi:thiol-disulfide isomerase/thioredoxin
MLIRSIALSLGALMMLNGCADPELAKRVDDLETQITALEAQAKAGPAGGQRRQAPAADPKAEQAARTMVEGIRSKINSLDWDGAKADCAKFASEFGGTQTFRGGNRYCEEAAVVGKDAKELDVERWFQGEVSLSSGPTLLVFWETWCPHCRREVPKIESTYQNFKGKGLNVVGLTKVTRSATDEGVAEFIKENNLTYPMAKEKGGNLSDHYGVRGVPAAALVKDGKVVWRGHPGRLDEALLNKML